VNNEIKKATSATERVGLKIINNIIEEKLFTVHEDGVVVWTVDSPFKVGLKARDFVMGETCEHDKFTEDYCEPCGRIHNG